MMSCIVMKCVGECHFVYLSGFLRCEYCTQSNWVITSDKISHAVLLHQLAIPTHSTDRSQERNTSMCLHACLPFLHHHYYSTTIHQLTNTTLNAKHMTPLLQFQWLGSSLGVTSCLSLSTLLFKLNPSLNSRDPLLQVILPSAQANYYRYIVDPFK